MDDSTLRLLRQAYDLLRRYERLNTGGSVEARKVADTIWKRLKKEAHDGEAGVG